MLGGEQSRLWGGQTRVVSACAYRSGRALRAAVAGCGPALACRCVCATARSGQLKAQPCLTLGPDDRNRTAPLLHRTLTGATRVDAQVAVFFFVLSLDTVPYWQPWQPDDSQYGARTTVLSAKNPPHMHIYAISMVFAYIVQQSAANREAESSFQRITRQRAAQAALRSSSQRPRQSEPPAAQAISHPPLLPRSCSVVASRDSSSDSISTCRMVQR
jgi:hypothetical protein